MSNLSLKRMGKKMNLTNFTNFTENDDAAIRQCFFKAVDSDLSIIKSLANVLNVKLHVIVQRAFQIGAIRYAPYSQWLLSHRREGWRSDEINVLIDNRNACRKLIGRVLDRTYSSVSKQMHCLRLMNGGRHYDWTQQEREVLRLMAVDHTIRQMASVLNREAIDIKHQCLELEIRLGRAGEEFTNGGLTREIRACKQRRSVDYATS